MESDNCEPDEIHLRTGVVTTNYLPYGGVRTNISGDIILTGSRLCRKLGQLEWRLFWSNIQS